MNKIKDSEMDLVRIAEEYYLQAKICFEKGLYILSCINSYLCAKSIIKAFLISQGGNFWFSHSLFYLCKKSENFDEGFKILREDSLKFDFAFRTINLIDPPLANDDSYKSNSRDFLDLAFNILTFVKKRLRCPDD
jgi:HEPN domain-containing protein